MVIFCFDVIKRVHEIPSFCRNTSMGTKMNECHSSLTLSVREGIVRSHFVCCSVVQHGISTTADFYPLTKTDCFEVNQKLNLIIDQFFDFRPYKREKARNFPHKR